MNPFLKIADGPGAGEVAKWRREGVPERVRRELWPTKPSRGKKPVGFLARGLHLIAGGPSAKARPTREHEFAADVAKKLRRQVFAHGISGSRAANILGLLSIPAAAGLAYEAYGKKAAGFDKAAASRPPHGWLKKFLGRDPSGSFWSNPLSAAWRVRRSPSGEIYTTLTGPLEPRGPGAMGLSRLIKARSKEASMNLSMTTKTAGPIPMNLLLRLLGRSTRIAPRLSMSARAAAGTAARQAWRAGASPGMAARAGRQVLRSGRTAIETPEFVLGPGQTLRRVLESPEIVLSPAKALPRRPVQGLLNRVRQAVFGAGPLTPARLGPRGRNVAGEAARRAWLSGAPPAQAVSSGYEAFLRSGITPSNQGIIPRIGGWLRGKFGSLNVTGDWQKLAEQVVTAEQVVPPQVMLGCALIHRVPKLAQFNLGGFAQPGMFGGQTLQAPALPPMPTAGGGGGNTQVDLSSFAQPGMLGNVGAQLRSPNPTAQAPTSQTPAAPAAGGGGGGGGSTPWQQQQAGTSGRTWGDVVQQSVSGVQQAVRGAQPQPWQQQQAGTSGRTWGDVAGSAWRQVPAGTSGRTMGEVVDRSVANVQQTARSAQAAMQGRPPAAQPAAAGQQQPQQRPATQAAGGGGGQQTQQRPAARATGGGGEQQHRAPAHREPARDARATVQHREAQGGKKEPMSEERPRVVSRGRVEDQRAAQAPKTEKTEQTGGPMRNVAIQAGAGRPMPQQPQAQAQMQRPVKAASLRRALYQMKLAQNAESQELANLLGGLPGISAAHTRGQIPQTPPEPAEFPIELPIDPVILMRALNSSRELPFMTGIRR